jgi:hypothetical protein
MQHNHTLIPETDTELVLAKLDKIIKHYNINLTNLKYKGSWGKTYFSTYSPPTFVPSLYPWNTNIFTVVPANSTPGWDHL